MNFLLGPYVVFLFLCMVAVFLFMVGVVVKITGMNQTDKNIWNKVRSDPKWKKDDSEGSWILWGQHKREIEAKTFGSCPKCGSDDVYSDVLMEGILPTKYIRCSKCEFAVNDAGEPPHEAVSGFFKSAFCGQDDLILRRWKGGTCENS